MNNNVGFNIVPCGQQYQQIIAAGGFTGLQQQVQQTLPVQNTQYILGGFPSQNLVQQPGMSVSNFPNQHVSMNGPTYTCINQNGMTYIAITPTVQQSQCYQAIQTPQGLQLFQVVTNPVNLNQYNCVQNSVAQNFLPQPISVQPHNASQSFDTQIPLQPNLIQYEQECSEIPENHCPENVVSSEEQMSEIKEEEEESSEEPDDGANVYEETEFVQTRREDPLAALTSLTSSISSINQHNSHGCPSLSSNNISPTSQMEKQPASSVFNLSDQQFPPNARAFQVLVPTPQGMAIQTVVASYDGSSPMNGSTTASGSFLNLDTSLNPQLVNLPTPQVQPSSITPAPACAVSIPSTELSSARVNTPTQSALVQVKDITSPCHSTTTAGIARIESESHAISPLPLVEAPSLIPLPAGSPHCLPDSTDDLCQPTIKQSTSSVVDGIDLEDIREFARSFKMRRLVLGLTQTQVGQALCATEGPAYSQSAICRFEKLDITPRSALKIRPVLENWLREAEEKHQQGNGHSSGIEYVNLSSIGKIRKRRTFFSPEALLILNNRFFQNSHPSGRDISVIANEIGYERDVVRVWFCNKRQSLRHCHSFQRSRSNSAIKSSDSSRDRSPTPPSTLP